MKPNRTAGKRKVITGWIGKKTELLQIDRNGSPMYDIVSIYMTRGNKYDYDIDNWPPRKVRITIEEL